MDERGKEEMKGHDTEVQRAAFSLKEEWIVLVTLASTKLRHETKRGYGFNGRRRLVDLDRPRRRNGSNGAVCRRKDLTSKPAARAQAQSMDGKARGGPTVSEDVPECAACARERLCVGSSHLVGRRVCPWTEQGAQNERSTWLFVVQG